MAATDAWMHKAMSPRVYRDIKALPTEPVAIVLGAKVYPNGRLSAVLCGRVDAAVDLYKAGKVRKLLMTGDNSSLSYDEVTPMKEYAMAKGVPEIAIVRDYAGFRTFDSCYRAKHVFDIDRAVMVTQDFHIARAVYLARRCGIDAVGFVAPNNMSARELCTMEGRELPAALMAVADTHIPGKRSHFVGEVEPISIDRPGR